MKITMPNGFIFEGTQAEYDVFMATLEAQSKALDEAKEQPEETIEFEGEQYRKVDRKAQAGDVVIISKDDGRLPDWFTVGKSYKVTSKNGRTVIFDDVGDWASVYFRTFGRTPETVDVYEKVEAEYVPQEGDIVVVTANTNASRNEVGDVGKIHLLSLTGTKGAWVNVPQRPLTHGANGNFTLLEEFRKATPAEVEAYEKAVADAKESEKWAKIGRKVGEFKVGDVVEITRYQYGAKVGEIVKVDRIDDNGVHYPHHEGSFGFGADFDAIKLVAPVESTLN